MSFNKDSRSFTDGAHIVPFLFPDGKWRWVVTEIDGDTWNDGIGIDPDVIANSERELVHRKGVE
jgi:hypothetical protein